MPDTPFGLAITTALPNTTELWDVALLNFFELRSDPLELLSPAIIEDERFIMGPLFRAAYTILSGGPLSADGLRTDLGLVHKRRGTASAAEQAHADALGQLARHNFTLAAELWDEVARANPRDFLAIRIAHDIYLHVGNNEARLASLEAVRDGYEPDEVAAGLFDGMLTFAYEELGRYDEAETLGREVIEKNPSDIWAVHALAHVYEMQGRSEPSLGLLSPDGAWTGHTLLSNHLWWHRGIRLTAERRLDEALAIADLIEFDHTTAFSMCDFTSLLWRVEYYGGDVGNRWDQVVDAWPKTPARHTCGFLDLHAVMAFAATDSPELSRWLDTLNQQVDTAAQAPEPSENDATFAEVVQPLVRAMAGVRSIDRAAAIKIIDSLRPQIHRIGGSVAQRDVVNLSIIGPTFGASS